MCIKAAEIKASNSIRVLPIPSMWHLVYDIGLMVSFLKELCRTNEDSWARKKVSEAKKKQDQKKRPQEKS